MMFAQTGGGVKHRPPRAPTSARPGAATANHRGQQRTIRAAAATRRPATARGERRPAARNCPQKPPQTEASTPNGVPRRGETAPTAIHSMRPAGPADRRRGRSPPAAHRKRTARMERASPRSHPAPGKPSDELRSLRASALPRNPRKDEMRDDDGEQKHPTGLHRPQAAHDPQARTRVDRPPTTCSATATQTRRLEAAIQAGWADEATCEAGDPEWLHARLLNADIPLAAATGVAACAVDATASRAFGVRPEDER